MSDEAGVFLAPPMTIRLVFDDERYAGLVVRARSMSIGDYLEFQALSARAEETVSGSREMLSVFADRIVSWNIADPETGSPVPATLDGLLTLEPNFVLDMIRAWRAAMTGVTKDQGKGSGSGETSPELSVPMELT